MSAQTFAPIVCSYCGQTVPPATLYYTSRFPGNGSTTTTYCVADFDSHHETDVQSGLTNFGNVVLSRFLTEGG